MLVFTELAGGVHVARGLRNAVDKYVGLFAFWISCENALGPLQGEDALVQLNWEFGK